MTWTDAPMCERCWIDREGEWKPIDDVADQLVAIRMPHRLVEPTLERCGFCGAPTISGIYQRADLPDQAGGRRG
jgi:hypothetical protein